MRKIVPWTPFAHAQKRNIEFVGALKRTLTRRVASCKEGLKITLYVAFKEWNQYPFIRIKQVLLVSID